MRSTAKTWVALLPAMLVPLAASFFYFIIFSEHRFVRPIYAVVKLFTLVWPVLCTYWLLRSTLPRPDLRRRHHWRSIPVGVLVGLLTVGVMYGLMITPVGQAVHAASDRIRTKVHALGIMPYYGGVTVFFSVFHSFLEEFYW